MTTPTRGDFRGFVELDRPFIDDHPPAKYGWEATSVWGSRPVREFGRGIQRGAARIRRRFLRAWTRAVNTARDRG